MVAKADIQVCCLERVSDGPPKTEEQHSYIRVGGFFLPHPRDAPSRQIATLLEEAISLISEVVPPTTEADHLPDGRVLYEATFGLHSPKESSGSSSICNFPDEIIMKIFDELDPRSGALCMATCREWRIQEALSYFADMVDVFGACHTCPYGHKIWKEKASCVEEMQMQSAWREKPSVDHTIIKDGVLDIAIGDDFIVTSGTNGGLLIHERKKGSYAMRFSKQTVDDDFADDSSERSSRSSIEANIGGGTLQTSKTANGHLGPIFTVAVTKDNSLMYSGGYDKTVKIVLLLYGNAPLKRRTDNSGFPRYCWTTKELLTSSFGGALSVWDTAMLENETPRLVDALMLRAGVSSLVARKEHRGHYFIGDHEGHLQLWDLTSRQRISDVHLSDNMLHCASYRCCPSELVFAGGKDGVVSGYDPRQALQAPLPVVINGRQPALASAIDENKLLVGRADNRVEVFDTRRPEETIRVFSTLSKPFCIEISDEEMMIGSSQGLHHYIFPTPTMKLTAAQDSQLAVDAYLNNSSKTESIIKADSWSGVVKDDRFRMLQTLSQLSDAQSRKQKARRSLAQPSRQQFH